METARDPAHGSVRRALGDASTPVAVRHLNSLNISPNPETFLFLVTFLVRRAVRRYCVRRKADRTYRDRAFGGQFKQREVELSVRAAVHDQEFVRGAVLHCHG